MKKLTALLFSTALAALLALPAFAQSPSGAFQSIAPLTRDLGGLITMTAATPNTYVSADQTGYNISRVACVLNIATKVGAATATFKIQNKDRASGLYYDTVASTAVSNAATPTPLYVGGGVATASNVSIGVPIAATWRVSATVGSATNITGSVGCSVQ